VPFRFGIQKENCGVGRRAPSRADLLRTYNLEPRHRVLLTSPPGNGKTTLAESMADALMVPLFVVRYEAVIGSFPTISNARSW
jgi:AAA+ superfamily predicted ATPase